MDRLDDKRCGGAIPAACTCHRRARRLEIAEGNQRAFGEQAPVGVVVLGLADHAQRTQGPAVEGVVGGDKRGAAGEAVGQLQRPLHRLGPRVYDETLAEGPGQHFSQALDQIELRQCVEHVGGLHEAPRLLANRLDEGGVAVAQARDAPARHEVDVLPTRHVTHPRPASLDKGHRQALHDR